MKFIVAVLLLAAVAFAAEEPSKDKRAVYSSFGYGALPAAAYAAPAAAYAAPAAAYAAPAIAPAYGAYPYAGYPYGNGYGLGYQYYG